MNLKDGKYSHCKLVQEMMQTPDVIRRFDPQAHRKEARRSWLERLEPG